MNVEPIDIKFNSEWEEAKKKGIGSLSFFSLLISILSYDNPNLVCHVILDTTEKWKERHSGNYPRKVFLNIDGGPENASGKVLGLMDRCEPASSQPAR